MEERRVYYHSGPSGMWHARVYMGNAEIGITSDYKTTSEVSDEAKQIFEAAMSSQGPTQPS